MTLMDEAVRAEQIGDIFGRYRSSNPEFVQTINATVAELAGLAYALREIYYLLYNTPDGDYLFLIEDDLKLVHESITCILADLWFIIGNMLLIPGTVPMPEDYRRNWKDIMKYCRRTGGQELSARLDVYRRFLTLLIRTLRSHVPNLAESGRLRHNLREIAPPANRQSIGAPDPEPPPRTEPANLPVQVTPRRSYERHRDFGAMSPSESGSSSPPFVMPPQPVPSPPTSPTDTFSNISQISSVDREAEHWAKVIFRDVPSFTPLPESSERTKFHDSSAHPRGDASRSFEDALVLTFPPNPPGLLVSLKFRRRDFRAKIVVSWRDRNGNSRSECLPLDMLVIYRKGPMLHVCRRSSDLQPWVMWLSLKFTTIERLVLFHGVFLSMRARDRKKPARATDDWELNDEVIEYAGKIREGDYTYVLYICRDSASKAIRLQSSIRGGPADRTPVWTAFITHPITSRTWCERLDRTKVCLRELQPRVFSDDFEFQRLSNGAFILSFDSRDDTKDFLSIVEMLGREYRRMH